MRYFETIFLEDIDDFFTKLDHKTVRKILYNIDLAEQNNDPKLFKVDKVPPNELERAERIRDKYFNNKEKI